MVAIATDLESESDLEYRAEVETESEAGGEERSAFSGVSRSSGAECRPLLDERPYRRIVETDYEIVKEYNRYRV